ncbi:hypothetical protein [Nocardioides sp.]|uniref:hypothetical protein n=1 Tax=Nocardioides sp. TaxID=35761 RepID=UPI0025E65BCE|nr:hypothetical protein [Nocardioides sp.]
MPLKYPFSAVVGCEYDPTTASGLDDMGLALVLTSISPEIGGVLVLDRRPRRRPVLRRPARPVGDLA